MILNDYDIARPGRLLTRLKSQYAAAKTPARRESLIRRHAVVEARVRAILDLVSMRSASDKIN